MKKARATQPHKQGHVLGTQRQVEESENSAGVETSQENEGQHKGLLYLLQQQKEDMVP